jgi:hypothetical protein
MTSTKDPFEWGLSAARRVIEVLFSPWQVPGLCIDAYESGIHAVTDLQVVFARSVETQPIRYLVARSAELTRDFGATQVSSARWFLDA